MKSIVIKILFILVLIIMVITLTGCTLTIETTDNSVSASVDGDTTKKVENIFDWIKEKLSGIFQFEKEENTNPIGNGKGTIL